MENEEHIEIASTTTQDATPPFAWAEEMIRQFEEKMKKERQRLPSDN